MSGRLRTPMPTSLNTQSPSVHHWPECQTCLSWWTRSEPSQKRFTTCVWLCGTVCAGITSYKIVNGGSTNTVLLHNWSWATTWTAYSRCSPALLRTHTKMSCSSRWSSGAGLLRVLNGLVQAVIDRLEARHLRPLGTDQGTSNQLEAFNTLMKHLQEHVQLKGATHTSRHWWVHATTWCVNCQ